MFQRQIAQELALLYMPTSAAGELELEIRRQQAIESYAWARRIFRRATRTETEGFRIEIDGLSHSQFRRHFGSWSEVKQTFKKIELSKQEIADRAQAHRFAPSIDPLKSDPFFVNRRALAGFGHQPVKKRRKVRKSRGSKDYRFNETTEVVIVKEERELNVGTQLDYWLDFGRFQTSKTGAAFNFKVFRSGTFVVVTKVKAVYKHHWHCPKVTLYCDTVKLSQDPQNKNKFNLHLPWDRNNEEA